ncbi:MAG TPA: ABC transporter substrate-binding protein, partial [Anaerolineae bacterium]|nr:ABC transporter substrate-binding protein [Anaerolineae bacterium]
MSSKLKGLLVTLVIIIVIGVVAGCQQGAGATEPIRVGFNTWVGFGPFYIAQEKGFFAKRGLNVELQRIEGTGDRRSAFIAGRLEGMGSTVDDLIIGAAQGVQGKMVLGLDESIGADGILTTKDITEVADFKGKSIAVQPGFVNHFFLLYILDANGLTSKDVTVVPMEPDKASAAFVADEVDIAVTWEPHLSEVEKNRPDGKRFLTTNDYPGIIVDILTFRNDVIDNRPDDVRAFVDAWYEAVDYLQTNPEEANAIIAEA